MANADEQRQAEMVEDHEVRMRKLERRMDEAFPEKKDTDKKKP